MKDTMGIILAGETRSGLRELTRSRSVSAVPVGGRYRIIDFILSNMVNSGIRNVGVITQNNYHSLMDHLESGKEWDLSRKRDGLFILPPYATRNNSGWYKGDVDALHGIMPYIRRSTQKYVVLSGGHILCNLTFDDVLDSHIQKGADITVLYKEENQPSSEALTRSTLLYTCEDQRVWDMEVNSTVPRSNKLSMEMYIMEKSLLEYLVEECVARGNYNFTKDILLKKMDLLKIFGYPYQGYVAFIDSIHSFYKHNMELLDPIHRYELFFRSGLVYTKVKDEVPAKYSDTARVSNCMVADGCIIEGQVENSILFRGVKIARGACVRNSIIMQNAEIQEDALLENVILDKEVLVRRTKRLIGQESFPVLIGKKQVI